MVKAAHDERGRFAVGNPGGPGRPRRPIEREYLRALNEAVSLEDWQGVVRAAVAQAKEGDGKAREWLARYLIGDDPPSLIDLYVDDVVVGGGLGTEVVKALIRYVKDSRHRSTFDAEELSEATRLLQDSLAGRLHDGEDGDRSHANGEKRT
jgi:GNAT superfamily N-acetyltransferase